MARGKPEENNPKRRPQKPKHPIPHAPGNFKTFGKWGHSVPLDSPLRKEEKEMRRFYGLPESMNTAEQLRYADEALRKRPQSPRDEFDERYDQDKSSY